MSNLPAEYVLVYVQPEGHLMWRMVTSDNLSAGQFLNPFFEISMPPLDYTTMHICIKIPLGKEFMFTYMCTVLINGTNGFGDIKSGKAYDFITKYENQDVKENDALFKAMTRVYSAVLANYNGPSFIGGETSLH